MMITGLIHRCATDEEWEFLKKVTFWGVCAICDTEYPVIRRCGQRYCSDDCRRKAMANGRRKHREKTCNHTPLCSAVRCVECDNQFHRRNGRQICCSKSCYAERRRRKDGVAKRIKRVAATFRVQNLN